ncbi:MAG: DUF998 domain-containing protein [Candidatus Nanopelagicales bacterium]
MAPPTVPWWGRLSSLLAPILLIGGWTVAAALQLQPRGFDSTTGTISELAGLGADSRWVMTVGIAGTGVCHLLTASALRPAARGGRILLALGGVFTLLVAAFPLPAGGGSSPAHTAVAFAAFVLLTVWAGFSPRSTVRGFVPWGLRRPVARLATAVLALATLAFFASVVLGVGPVGLLERVAAGAQVLWPLLVVASVPRRR